MSNQADGANTCQFIDNLDRDHKVLLPLGGLLLPFNKETNMSIKRFVVAAVSKILM